MFKEYKTIREVVGPLMLVEGVEGVKYGEIRHGKVLEINRDKAVVQLFENSQGLHISSAKARLRVTDSSLRFQGICWGGCSTVWVTPATEVLPLFPIK